MSTGDEYRVRAAEFGARARRETDAGVRADLENLARSYLRLADLAEQNQRLDISYETPPPKDGEAGVRPIVSAPTPLTISRSAIQLTCWSRRKNPLRALGPCWHR
jgi:hypothetical protein